MKCWCFLHDHVLLYLSDAYFFSHIIIWFIHISYCEYIVIDRYIFIIHPFQCPCGFVQDWNIYSALTHWGRVTHICVGKLIIIGSDNGLSPERRQAIIWPNAGILLIGPLGTNFSEILIEIQTLSLKKTRLKMSSAKSCSFHLGLNVLMMEIPQSCAKSFICVILDITNWYHSVYNWLIWKKSVSFKKKKVIVCFHQKKITQIFLPQIWDVKLYLKKICMYDILCYDFFFPGIRVQCTIALYSIYYGYC